jgi:transcriptional regulator with XRE-family HTH domain
MRSEKQGARAGQLDIPLSTLSNYWSGRRVPRVDTLRRIYHAVQAHSASTNMPVTLAELEALRTHAQSGDRDRQAARVVAGYAAEVQAPREVAVPVGSVPAVGPAQDRRSSRNGRVQEVLEVLRTARASGDLRHLIGTAWSASRTLSLAEFCEAVGALHSTGDTDLAETLLLADSERGADDTMRVSLALLGAGLTGAAELIMRASLPSGGSERG